MNRKIQTSLFNLLDLINCSEDYGFGDDIFYHSMFQLIGNLTDGEIEDYSRSFLTDKMRKEGYSEEDAIQAIERLTKLREKYQNA